MFDQLGLRPDRGVIALLIVYMLGWAALHVEPISSFVVQHLILVPRRAIGPEPWQLLTSEFFMIRLRMVLNVAVTLLFFGNTMEQLLGAKRLWIIWVVGAFGGSLAAALMGLVLAPNSPMPGAGAGSALLVVYAVMLSGRQAMLFGATPVRVGVIAWFWIGIQALGAVVDMGEGQAVAGILELTEMAGGCLAGWWLAHAFKGGRSAGGGVRDSLDRFKLWRLRRRYQVLDGGRKGGPDKKDKRYLN
jgi:membrane associated rhomboid family serine protease